MSNVCNNQIGVYARIAIRPGADCTKNQELYSRSDMFGGNCTSQYSFNLKNAPAEENLAEWIGGKVLLVETAGGTSAIFSVDGATGETQVTPGYVSGGDYSYDGCSDTFYWKASYASCEDAQNDENCIAKFNEGACEACGQEEEENPVGPPRPAWEEILECNSRPPIGPEDPPQPIQKECLYQFRVKYNCTWDVVENAIGSPYLAHKVDPLAVGQVWWDNVMTDIWVLCSDGAPPLGDPGPPCNPVPARVGQDIYLVYYKKIINQVPGNEAEETECPDSIDPEEYPSPPTFADVNAIFSFAGVGCPRHYKLTNCVTNFAGQCGVPWVGDPGQHMSLGYPNGSPAGLIISTPFDKQITVPVMRGHPVAIGPTYYSTTNGAYANSTVLANTCYKVEELLHQNVAGALTFARQTAPWHYPDPQTDFSYGAPNKYQDCNGCAADPVLAIQTCNADYVDPAGDCDKITKRVNEVDMVFRTVNVLDNPAWKIFFEANTSFIFSDAKACWRVDYIANPTTFQRNLTFWQSCLPTRYGGRGPACVTYTGAPLSLSATTINDMIDPLRAPKHDTCCKCQDINMGRDPAWIEQIDKEICNPTKGACCNDLSAQCKDGITRAECNGFRVGNNEPDPPSTTFFPKLTCADLRAGPIGGKMRCQLPIGACCQGDGDCKDNKSYNNCLDNHNGIRWRRNKTCFDSLANGQCPPDVGACCDMNQNRGNGRCRHLTYEQCKNLRNFQNNWWKGLTSNCSTCTPKVGGDRRGMPSGCCKRVRDCDAGVNDRTKVWVVQLQIWPDYGCSNGRRDASGQSTFTLTMWTLSGGTYGFVGNPKGQVGRWTCVVHPGDNFRKLPGKILSYEYKSYGSIPSPICSRKYQLKSCAGQNRAGDRDVKDCTFKDCGCWGAISGFFCKCSHSKNSVIARGTSGCAWGGGCSPENYTNNSGNHKGTYLRNNLAEASCDCPKGEGYPTN